MEVRHVDITVVSANDLKKVNLIGKMHTYAVVWVDPYYRQSTGVDEDGGAKPQWNQKLSFPVPEHFFQQPTSRLTVEIYSKGSFTDDKFVGAASIPLSEIAQKANQEEASTYDVMRKSGKQKGSVRLSIRVGEKTTVGPPAGQPPAAMPVAYDNKQHDAQAGSAVPYGYDNKQHDGAGAAAVPYGYPPPTGVPAAPAPYGYPPQAPYPQAYAGGYGGQGYYQPGAAPPPPQYYAAQPPPNRRPGFGGGGGGLGMGLGAGLLAGAVGGLVVGEMVDDAFDGCDGGFDF